MHRSRPPSALGPGRAAASAVAEPRRPVHARSPAELRVTIDWAVTIVGAVAIVLLVKAFVVNPYRIPSSSMEPTLHCAAPAIGCEARFSDRVLANRFIYHLRDPRRGEIIVFKTPPEAQIKCGAGGTFVKRLIGLPGDTLEVRLRGGNGYVYINGKPLNEPYIQPDRRATAQAFGPVQGAAGELLHDGRQPLVVVRLADVGHGSARQPDRQGLRDLLAAEQNLAALKTARRSRASLW